MRTHILLLPALLMLVPACSTSEDPAGPALTALSEVVPSGGSADVDVQATITVRFDHALMSGMEQYAALHEGPLTGPEVVGDWRLSSDRMTLTFVPAAPLRPATTYTIHIGGGMRDAQGRRVDMEPGTRMGGHQVTGGMMSGTGMGSGNGMMGPGWSGGDGYGMSFTFTTAS